MPPKKPASRGKQTSEEEVDNFAHLDKYPGVPLMLISRQRKTIDVHSNCVSVVTLGVTKEPRIFTAGADCLVSIWNPVTWEQTGGFGQDRDWHFGGEEEWQGPYVHRSMPAPITALVARKNIVDPPPGEEATPPTTPPVDSKPGGKKPVTPKGKAKPGKGKAEVPEVAEEIEPEFSEELVSGNSKGMLQLWRMYSP
eukprot:CAMPEP_0196588618 /NCGR_PEP_ID=MMETSP1081-20130531/61126_1 /TAXON_ID=36882 /ORGANISM="Pyramimonas amylifera, Strain CCMP720" /LENGTH=195 /DNA_ID=CAMNT_0041911163 /DNA_START=25 /DNA_END=608 /DNA_ORIENTATION=-